MHDNASENLGGDGLRCLSLDNFHPDLKMFLQYGDHEEAPDEH